MMASLKVRGVDSGEETVVGDLLMGSRGLLALGELLRGVKRPLMLSRLGLSERGGLPLERGVLFPLGLIERRLFVKEDKEEEEERSRLGEGRGSERESKLPTEGRLRGALRGVPESF